MKIAILSGKGGTGKTFIAVNLASVVNKSNLLDCDVEEPNAHLFLNSLVNLEEKVKVIVPKVDKNKCNGSRKCVEFCKFNALAFVGGSVKVFDDLCHSCGGCMLLCPSEALLKTEKEIGVINYRRFNDSLLVSGVLNPGVASGVPIITQLLKSTRLLEEALTIIDCPPGIACTVNESVKDADYCLLVAEPTIFGLHNLKMVVDLVKFLEKPFGVVINKSVPEVDLIKDYCQDNNIKVLIDIPYDPILAELNSKGLIAVKHSDKYQSIFLKLLAELNKEVASETITNS